VAGPIDHGSEFDPISYIRAVGLQPEDTYGFLPIEHQDVTPYFFLYRDRPEYRERREALPLSQMRAGAIPMPNEQQAKLDMDRDLIGGSEGKIGQKVAEMANLAESFGGQPLSEWDPSAAAAAAPNVANLQKLAEMLSKGDITPQEYQQLMQKEMAAPAAAPTGPQGQPAPDALPEAGSIVAQRIYPGMGRSMRMSNNQLDEFLPKYRKTLQLRSEDTYGVLPRVTRMSQTASNNASEELEWDDFWIVYRDRPEYEEGREKWASSMGKGDWPDTVITPGVSDPSGVPFDDADIKVEKDVWPRAMLVMRKRSDDLGDAIRKKIAKWKYEPEDSFGFTPSYANESIYFAWRKK
jgi:hypothetical protein